MAEPVRYKPDRRSVTVAVILTSATWSALLVGVLATAIHLGTTGVVAAGLVSGLTLATVWSTDQTRRLHRVRLHLRPRLLYQRCFGLPGRAPTDDGRALRPVGVGVADLVARTNALLAPLIDIPSVRIFHSVRPPGVWPPGAPAPVASHAISAGPLLILLESVAWPPGRYQMDANGRIRCDGQYIGQNTVGLVTATNMCRDLLPRRHRVSALVVVHRIAEGPYVLPSDTRDLSWVTADELESRLRSRLRPYSDTVSGHAIAVLARASVESIDRE